MTVKELIKELEKLNQDAEVVIADRNNFVKIVSATEEYISVKDNNNEYQDELFIYLYSGEFLDCII